jgi:probable HAF family extracellular repeat protein
MGIDASGNVAGTATLPEGRRAVRRDRATGAIVSLGTLGGAWSSTGEYYGDNTFHVMNDGGLMVGGSLTASGPTVHAFVWDSGRGIRDLNSLTPNKAGFSTLLTASAVSNTGFITGLGGVTKGGGYSHAFLLTPVP